MDDMSADGPERSTSYYTHQSCKGCAPLHPPTLKVQFHTELSQFIESLHIRNYPDVVTSGFEIFASGSQNSRTRRRHVKDRRLHSGFIMEREKHQAKRSGNHFGDGPSPKKAKVSDLYDVSVIKNQKGDRSYYRERFYAWQKHKGRDDPSQSLQVKHNSWTSIVKLENQGSMDSILGKSKVVILIWLCLVRRFIASALKATKSAWFLAKKKPVHIVIVDTATCQETKRKN
ncbi:hypothetical protein PsorP6_004223 [Peronosclerospora sorghi]|uniref:Uncharacterized protein n=1 Tax=Peronosclerospora sorghi TaxID=230839 RepID=A0ACC0VME4_9STRA|nr:hypothetical protein PsorP6_004223 [Peronosclerospora sorghi]